jgi:hypothetical protein
VRAAASWWTPSGGRPANRASIAHRTSPVSSFVAILIAQMHFEARDPVSEMSEGGFHHGGHVFLQFGATLMWRSVLI